MNETTAKVCEEQVAGLTIENAHRVTMIRKKGTDYPPVPFLFRKEHQHAELGRDFSHHRHHRRIPGIFWHRRDGGIHCQNPVPDFPCALRRIPDHGTQTIMS